MTDPKLSTSDIASKPDATRDSSLEDEVTRSEDSAAPSAGQSAPAADEPLQREAEAGDDNSVRPRGRQAERESLLSADQLGRFTGRWQEIQASFVDQPRRSVEEADRLVADLMQRLAASFADERNRLEEQWDRGDDVSTEDLRLALTHYRSFFDRLLSA
jgi:hypothetical protein